jgi:hypothetical protein
VQMHVARLKLRLLVYRDALIAAVLNEDVGPVTMSPGVSIHGDGSVDAASSKRALVIGAIEQTGSTRSGSSFISPSSEAALACLRSLAPSAIARFMSCKVTRPTPGGGVRGAASTSSTLNLGSFVATAADFGVLRCAPSTWRWQRQSPFDTRREARMTSISSLSSNWPDHSITGFSQCEHVVPAAATGSEKDRVRRQDAHKSPFRQSDERLHAGLRRDRV